MGLGVRTYSFACVRGLSVGRYDSVALSLRHKVVLKTHQSLRTPHLLRALESMWKQMHSGSRARFVCAVTLE